MTLEQVFAPDRVVLQLESSEKSELFEELLNVLVSTQPAIDWKEALSALEEREAKMSTGIMHGIAVPHGNCATVSSVIGVIGISRSGIDYNALDNAPVHLVFMLLCNPKATEAHLEVLKELATVMQNPSFIKEVMEMQTGQEVYDLLCKYKSAVLG